ncbi:hypothetical protein Gotri_025297, partial [Gossypium trilobum]|nr:hypothetical protein [Gossypium trilobum]
MSNAWNLTRQMKRLAMGPMTTPEYNEWWIRRINDNIPKPSQGNNQSIEEHLRKLEVEKLRKGKNKADEDLDSLKTDYKKLRLSMKTVGLGETSKQWREEIREEKKKANRWERKFQEVQTRNEALEKSLSENRKEK